jgi:di/tricarboxylate transporter
MPPAANRVAAVAALMAVLWISEAIPIPAAALLPVVLCPLLGVMPVQSATANYAISWCFCSWAASGLRLPSSTVVCTAGLPCTNYIWIAMAVAARLDAAPHTAFGRSLMPLVCCWYMTRISSDLGRIEAIDGRRMIARERKSLGPMSRAEHRVTIVFYYVVLMWIFRDLIPLPKTLL